jgi:sucrose-phosphate synthase
MALADMGVKVDIITRRIDDPEWPEFSKEIDHYEGYGENLRIVRIEAGGLRFLNKERLWEHLDEFTDNVISFYGDRQPDFATAHYGDGGHCAVLLKKKSGLGYTFTGHSLGAQKLDKLGMSLDNFDSMERQYHFSKRIMAERLSMNHAFRIITSTSQERFEQYSHALYTGAVDGAVHRSIEDKTGGRRRPQVIVSSRLDEKKNIIGVVRAYALSGELQEKADLGIFIRGLDDPYGDLGGLPEKDRQTLRPILDVIEQEGLKDKVFFFNIGSQRELAATYRYFAGLGSVFALTAFYEPFGLAPIEAAACGLAVVATRNGGPSEIFHDGSGVLVDPFDDKDIAEGLLKGIVGSARYSEQGEKLVKAKYTWEKTAEAYLSVIREGAERPQDPKDGNLSIPELNAAERIKGYLGEKG